jgi:pSer/pThr/pTyr-binding forkhead associated (FHA) protein
MSSEETSMTQCQTCGRQVADAETICPDCGAELKPPTTLPPVSLPKVTPPSASPDVAPTALTPDAVLRSNPATVATPGAAARLTLVRGGVATSESFVIGKKVIVGRFDVESGPVDVDLSGVPEGAYLSRHHAEIWRHEDGRWLAKDLGSQNGTFVRSDASGQFRRVTTEEVIADGDEIAFGNARFEFHTT